MEQYFYRLFETDTHEDTPTYIMTDKECSLLINKIVEEWNNNTELEEDYEYEFAYIIDQLSHNGITATTLNMTTIKI